MIRACDRQLRVAARGAYGLDFAAVFAFAEAVGAKTPLLAWALPEIELQIVNPSMEED